MPLLRRCLRAGKKAQGDALVEIVAHHQVFHGKLASTDIIEASAHAYLRALNKAAASPTPDGRCMRSLGMDC